MGDYNWFSDESVQVATEGLRDEAKKWHDLADRMASVATLAAGQGLQPSAFSVIVRATFSRSSSLLAVVTSLVMMALTGPESIFGPVRCR